MVVMQEVIVFLQSLWRAVKDVVLRFCVAWQPQTCLDLCINLPGCTLRIRA